MELARETGADGAEAYDDGEVEIDRESVVIELDVAVLADAGVVGELVDVALVP